MPLTALQRKILKRYQLYRDSAPTLGKMMVDSAPAHFFLVIIIALASVFSYLFLDPSLSMVWYFVGFGLGLLSRDFGTFRQVVRFWPVFAQVVDFDKVDALLDGRMELPVPDGVDT